MDWDKTHICFTKRSLLEFLKWVAVVVAPSLSKRCFDDD
jgi:hypothetical protein